MSTIKSSDEHLTLNADGSSKDIKFQANGVEKASISSAGAFTSTTIDATKLTGDLPAISGAALTNIPATDISGKLSLSGGTMTGTLNALSIYLGDDNKIGADSGDYVKWTANTKTSFVVNGAEKLSIHSDGRGLSQFTAKAWCNANFNDSTPDINDSFNVSSIEYFGSTGYFGFHWDVDTADGDYAALVNCAVATSVSTGYVDYGFAQNSSYLRFQFYRNSSLYNPAKGYVVIFGD